MQFAAFTGWHMANDGQNLLTHWRRFGLLDPSEDPESLTGEEADQEIAQAYANEDLVRQAMANVGRRAVERAGVES